ncbi:MAG: hypothetical protein AAF581_03355 [Planctomycetota bacterium]
MGLALLLVLLPLRGRAVALEPGDLLVSSFWGNEVLRFDGNTGAPRGSFLSSPVIGPEGIAFGPDGHLYVVSRTTNSVLRFDGANGTYIDTFVAPGSGGLSLPHGCTFGADGHLYVASTLTDSVLRYDGTSGVFLGVFTVGGGLLRPLGLTFGPDGNLYVSGEHNHAVLRFSGTSGTFIDAFASGGGLWAPSDVTFGSDGDLYVTGEDSVLVYDGSTGAFLSTFVPVLSGGLDTAVGVRFGPDGGLYVASGLTNSVLCYSGQDGTFLGSFANAGLGFPTYVLFAPGGIPFERGDCNGNGNEDLADVVYLLAVLFGSEALPTCPDACDVNDDGTLHLSDVITQLTNLFVDNLTLTRSGVTGCVADSTHDLLGCAAPGTCP